MSYWKQSAPILILAIFLLPFVACSTNHTLATDDGTEVHEGHGSAPAASSFTLSPEERERAIDLAATARRSMEIEPVPGLVSEPREENLAIVVAVYPPTDASDDRRLAAVNSFDYSNGRAIRVIVDLTGERVVQARQVPVSSVPLTAQEEGRLRDLLREDSEEYRALLASDATNYDLGTFLSTGRDEELAGHRIVMVRPVYFGPAPQAPIAVVDLTRELVLRYEN